MLASTGSRPSRLVNTLIRLNIGVALLVLPHKLMADGPCVPCDITQDAEWLAEVATCPGDFYGTCDALAAGSCDDPGSPISLSLLFARLDYGDDTYQPIWDCSYLAEEGDIYVYVGEPFIICNQSSDLDGTTSPPYVEADELSMQYTFDGGTPCTLDVPDLSLCKRAFRVLDILPFTLSATVSDDGNGGCDDPDEECSATFVPLCLGPKLSRWPPYQLCPDGLSTAKVFVSHYREVDWTIIGSSLGCTLEKCPNDDFEWCWEGDCSGERHLHENDYGFLQQQVRVRAGFESGHITIRAFDESYPDCFVDQVVSIGCGTCVASDCGVGGEQVSVENGLLVKLDLGRDGLGLPLGFFYLQATTFDASLTTPAALRFSGSIYQLNAEYESIPRPSADPNAEFRGPQATDYQVLDKVENSISPPRWIWADVVYSTPDDDKYEIHVRNAEETESDPPFVSWVIDGTNRANAEFSVEKWTDGFPEQGATLQRVHRIQYEATGSDSYEWIVHQESSTGEVQRSRSVAHTAVGNNATQVVSTYEVVEGDPILVSQASEVWTTFSWASERTSETTNTGNGSLYHTWDYYDSPSGPSNLLKYELKPDGSWRWLTYYSDGRVHTELTPWKDSGIVPPTPPDPTSCREITFTYDVGTGTTNSGKIATLTEKVLGVAVGLTKFSYGDDGNGHPVTFTNECTNPTAASQDQDFLLTKHTYWDKDQRKLKLVQYPGGRADSYTDPDDDSGDFSVDSNGNPTFGGTGNDNRYTVEHTYPNPVASKSTKDMIVIDETGRRVWEESLVYTGSAYDSVPINRIVRKYDLHGQLEKVWHSDNTTIVYSYGCCGLDSVTAEDGIHTSYERDALGRLIRQTKEGIGEANDPDFQDSIVTEIEYTHDDDPLIRETKTHDGASTSALSSVEEIDLAGRTVRIVNNGLETEYAYSTSSSGGRIVTVTEPSGAVVATEYYRDGRTKSVTRGSTLEKIYEYGVNSDGSQWTKAYSGPDGLSSVRWTRTTTDTLGRTISDEHPAFASTQPVATVRGYDDSSAGGGRLVSAQATYNGEPLIAATCYEYDAVGNVLRTGLNLDGASDSDGDLNDTSGVLDRISQTDTNYVKIGSNWWRQTVTKVYVDGTATPVTVSQSREQLSGLTSPVIRVVESVDSYNEVTRETTELDDDKVVIVTTDHPGTGNNSVQVTQNGLPRSSKDKAQLTTTFVYDALGRRTKVTDARGNWTQTNYSSTTGQVTSVTNRHNDDTSYTYYGQDEPGAGHVKTITNGLGKVTRLDYDDHGRVAHTWGDVAQPTYVEYDDFGQRVELHAYRYDPGSSHAWTDATWPSNAGEGDVTAWQYDEATGLLTQKLYADEVGPTYTYTPDGKLYERKWVREVSAGTRLKATYGYSTGASGTGELLSIDYNDATPDVDFTYNRVGQLATVDDGVARRTFVYDTRLQRFNESFSDHPTTSLNLFGGRTIRTSFTDSVAYTPPGGMPTIHKFVRLGQLGFGPTATPTTEYNVNYDYDGNTDRMSKVTGPGLPASGANYTYLTDSDLVEAIQFRSSSSTVQAEIVRSYEPHRDLIESVENKMAALSPPTISMYQYENDDLARRKSCVRTGEAFGSSGSGVGDHNDVWTYNNRNELAVTDRFEGTGAGTPGGGTANTALDRTYDYDPIGNRKSYTEGAGSPLYYCANELNQYTATDNTGPNLGCPSPVETFSYDADGNLIGSDNIGEIAPGTPKRAIMYDWDAENRLVEVRPASPASGDKKVEFNYDYMGRRVQKTVSTYNGASWTATKTARFIWHNWLMMAELDNTSSPAVLKRYVWGLDLAGQSGALNSLDRAGGVGGLLGVYDYNGSSTDLKYVYCYDANGNVAQLLDPTATSVSNAIVAQYEYDASGTSLLSSCSYCDNSFGFSTKQKDAETDLGYWGYRYYDARVGKWLSRDPLEEEGSADLYSYCENNPTTGIDALGQQFVFPGAEAPGFNRQRIATSWDNPDILANREIQVGTITVSVLSCCNVNANATIAVGVFMTWTGEFRLAYDRALIRADQAGVLAGLSFEARKAQRDAIALAFDKWQTAFGKAVRKARRPPGQEHLRQKNTPNKSNPRLTGSAKYLARAGEACLVVGVVMDTIAIVTASEEDRPAVIARTAGGAAGALALGEAGMWCGLCFGGPYAGPAAAILGIGGSIAGACGAEWIIDWLIEP